MLYVRSENICVVFQTYFLQFGYTKVLSGPSLVPSQSNPPLQSRDSCAHTNPVTLANTWCSGVFFSYFVTPMIEPRISKRVDLFKGILGWMECFTLLYPSPSLPTNKYQMSHPLDASNVQSTALYTNMCYPLWLYFCIDLPISLNYWLPSWCV